MSVPVDLRLAIGGLQTTLQRSVRLVAIGLRATLDPAASEAGLPNVTMGIQFSPAETWTHDQARQEFGTWLLTNGFRDVSEGIGTFLEGVRQVLAFWAITNYGKGPTSIDGEEWNEKLVREAKKFHGAGLPDKLAVLSEQFGLVLPPLVTRQILSFNAARNCLVHRQGVVATRDLGGELQLSVAWVKVSLVATDQHGERELVPEMGVEGGGTITGRQSVVQRTFEKGERIQFSAQEFAEICFALFSFGSTTVVLAEEVGRAKGVTFVPPSEGCNITCAEPVGRSADCSLRSRLFDSLAG